MDVNAILNKPAFSNISTEQKTALRELVTKLQNKTIAEAMPIMLSFMQTAPKSAPLSAEQQAAMTEAVVESLDESERARFKALLSIAAPRK